MHAFTRPLANEHIEDLQREAAAAALARVATEAAGADHPAWRRQSGGAARRLSVALADLAVRLDPATHRPSYGRE